MCPPLPTACVCVHGVQEGEQHLRDGTVLLNGQEKKQKKRNIQVTSTFFCKVSDSVWLQLLMF